jgi:Flp pilus assembly pilin Flp
MLELAKRFAKDKSGAASLEYALIAAGLFLAVVMIASSLALHTANQ